MRPGRRCIPRWPVPRRWPTATDAGLPVAQLIGIDDFDQRLPWMLQATKYRVDYEEVYKSGKPNRDPTGAGPEEPAGKAP